MRKDRTVVTPHLRIIITTSMYTPTYQTDSREVILPQVASYQQHGPLYRASVGFGCRSDAPCVIWFLGFSPPSGARLCAPGAVGHVRRVAAVPGRVLGHAPALVHALLPVAGRHRPRAAPLPHPGPAGRDLGADTHAGHQGEGETSTPPDWAAGPRGRRVAQGVERCVGAGLPEGCEFVPKRRRVPERDVSPRLLLTSWLSGAVVDRRRCVNEWVNVRQYCKAF